MAHYEQVDYPKSLYMVFVDDGSTDATGQIWIHFKDAVPISKRGMPAMHGGLIIRGKVLRVWRSQRNPLWILVQKENRGGLKADALNAGLRFTRTSYVAIVDVRLQGVTLFRQRTGEGDGGRTDGHALQGELIG